MPGVTETEELLAAVKAGDPDAASELFNRYAKRLMGLARSRLDVNFQSKIDPEDVVQSVFGSFFRRHANSELEIRSWDNLWSLLAVITVHKCGHRVRHFRSAKRDTRLERTKIQIDEHDALAWEFIARDPSPSHATMLTETLEGVMAELQPHERSILTLSLQGCEIAEISAKVVRSERTVRRVLQMIREELEIKRG